MSVRCETRIECETSARDDHAPPPRDRAHLEIRQNRVRFVMCAARERGLELLQLVHGGGLQHDREGTRALNEIRIRKPSETTPRTHCALSMKSIGGLLVLALSFAAARLTVDNGGTVAAVAGATRAGVRAFSCVKRVRALSFREGLRDRRGGHSAERRVHDSL